jgi:hypothetical protein
MAAPVGATAVRTCPKAADETVASAGRPKRQHTFLALGRKATTAEVVPFDVPLNVTWKVLDASGILVFGESGPSLSFAFLGARDVCEPFADAELDRDPDRDRPVDVDEYEDVDEDESAPDAEVAPAPGPDAEADRACD